MDIEVGNLTNVERRTLSGGGLRISAKVVVDWTPPVSLDSFDGYQIILSLQPVSGFLAEYPQSAIEVGHLYWV